MLTQSEARQRLDTGWTLWPWRARRDSNLTVNILKKQKIHIHTGSEGQDEGLASSASGGANETTSVACRTSRFAKSERASSTSNR
jgi:hypothetical protein